MDSNLKTAVILSAIFVIILDAIMFKDSSAGEIFCMSGYLFAGFVIILWLALVIGKGIWKAEKIALNWVNDEPRKGAPPSTPPRVSSTKKIGSSKYQAYKWSGYGVVSGERDFMRSAFRIPYGGIMVTREDEYALFKRIEPPPGEKEEILRAAYECVSKRDCDLVIAWDGEREMACGDEEYLLEAYGIKYKGLVLKEGNFIRLFGHNCKNVTKEDMLNFVEKSKNSGELALMLMQPGYAITSLSEQVAEKMMNLPRDVLIITYPHDGTTYFYDVPFRIRNEKELREVGDEVRALHAEVGVIIQWNGKTLGVMKSYIASAMVPNSEEGEIGDDIVFLETEEGEISFKPVRWRAWSKEEIIKVARDAFNL